MRSMEDSTVLEALGKRGGLSWNFDVLNALIFESLLRCEDGELSTSYCNALTVPSRVMNVQL